MSDETPILNSEAERRALVFIERILSSVEKPLLTCITEPKILIGPGKTIDIEWINGKNRLYCNVSAIENMVTFYGDDEYETKKDVPLDNAYTTYSIEGNTNFNHPNTWIIHWLLDDV